MTALKAIWRVVGQLSGVEIAYVLGIVNAALALADSFGAHLSSTQDGYITSIVNGVLVLLLHLAAKTTPPRPPAGT